MKLKIMPEFHLNKTEDEMKDEFKSFYTGTNALEGKIVNNTLYLVSFFIPFVLLLLMMNYFGFAPFGPKSMFVLDGATQNLSILTQTIAQFRNGSFHLFSLTGSLGNETFSTILFYLTSPFTLFTLLFTQETAIGLLALFCVLRISLSAPIFLYYLTHRELGRKGSKYDVTLLIFSLGYAMSSYALIQYNDFMFLDCFMLFPLLMLGLEKLIMQKPSKLFYSVLTICLLSNFYLGLILILFSILLFFFTNSDVSSNRFLVFPKFLKAILLALASASITVIPGLYGLFNNIISQSELLDPYRYQDYFQLFLQHFFFNDPSYLRVFVHGSNLYIGIIILPLVCLHFLNKNYSIKKRISDAVLLLLLIFSLNHSSINYFFQLKSVFESSFIPYAFVYLFVLLAWSFDDFKSIRDIPLWRVFLALLIPIVGALLAMNLSTITPNFNSVNYTIDILIVLAILVILYRLGSIKRNIFYTLATAIVLLELIANSFQNVYMLSLEEITLANVLANEESDAFTGSLESGRSEIFNNEYSDNANSNHLFSRYSQNPMTTSKAETIYNPLSDSLASIQYLYISKEQDTTPNSLQYTKVGETSDYTIYENRYAFPTAYFFDENTNIEIDNSTPVNRLNSIAKLLGSDSEIFREVPLDITTSISHDLSAKIYPLGNQMFALAKVALPADSTEEYPSVYKIKFEFKAPEDGELYLYFNDLDYYDKVSKGSDYSFTYYDPLQFEYNRVVLLKGYYFNEEALLALQEKLNESKCNIKQTSSSMFEFVTDSQKEQTLVSILPYQKNYKIKIDGVKASYHDFNNQLAITVPAGKHQITVEYSILPLWLGLFVSLLTALLMICASYCKEVKQAFHVLFYYTSSAYCAVIRVCSHWVFENYVYLLAFFIPFFTAIIAMISIGATPFGPYTIFSDDGIQITLPSLQYSIAHMRAGNSFHTWVGGAGRAYGTAAHPILSLFSFSTINTLVPLFVITYLSLSGVFLVFYLTHREIGKKAYKKDFRLLIAALCYSMSNYSLLMINNYSWYYAFVLFPLILFGMDMLMMKKKKRYFIFFLALSIYLQSYISMFICIYLVIRFFSYPFDNFWDFVKKGVRFALSAISMVGLCYTTIFGTVTMLNTTAYGNDYTPEGFTMPVSGWFNDWSYILKQQMIFPEHFTISWNEGAANLYFGILTVLLLVLYLFARKVSIKDKLRQLIPFAILYVTLNQTVMNYIMNGLHYQNGVPNRFVFLITLIVGIIGYDALCTVSKQNVLNIIPAILIVIGIFTYAYLDSPRTEMLTKSFAISICLCVIYCVLLLLICYRKKQRRLFTSILVCLFCGEICINAYSTICQHRQALAVLTYSKDATEYLKENLALDDTLERVSQHSPLTEDYPLVDLVKSNHLFATGSINAMQQNATAYFGISTGDNILATANSQTLMGESFGCNRYLIVNNIGHYKYGYDLDDYKLIAVTDSNFILENPYCFPFAYYLPMNVIEEQKTSESPYDVWQTLSYYMNPTDEFLISVYPVYKDSSLPEDEGNYYIETVDESTKMERMHLEIPVDGYVYLHVSDFYYLDYHKQGDILEFDFDASSYHSGEFPDPTVLCIINKEVVKDLQQIISENPLTITAFTDESIDGTIHMPEDGVVNFSMPYDANWKAYVDGKETETIAHANAYLAVPATEGDHEIHLEYGVKVNQKPNFIFYASWAVFFLCVIGCDLYRKRRKAESLHIH